ncbi:MAG: hypothetical protein N2482_01845 [Patescibacteria group bacterium]|nr:hypothetical protein [Patescibacteria group bacterium]
MKKMEPTPDEVKVDGRKLSSFQLNPFEKQLIERVNEIFPSSEGEGTPVSYAIIQEAGLASWSLDSAIQAKKLREAGIEIKPPYSKLLEFPYADKTYWGAPELVIGICELCGIEYNPQTMRKGGYLPGVSYIAGDSAFETSNFIIRKIMKEVNDGKTFDLARSLDYLCASIASGTPINKILEISRQTKEIEGINLQTLSPSEHETNISIALEKIRGKIENGLLPQGADEWFERVVVLLQCAAVTPAEDFLSSDFGRNISRINGDNRDKIKTALEEIVDLPYLPEGKKKKAEALLNAFN